MITSGVEVGTMSDISRVTHEVSHTQSRQSQATQAAIKSVKISVDFRLEVLFCLLEDTVRLSTELNSTPHNVILL